MRVALVLAVLAAWCTPPAQAQTIIYDNSKCYAVKDSIGSGEFTLDLYPKDSTTFVVEPGDIIVGGALVPGCRVRMPAKYFCIDVDGRNARSTRPPFDAAQWTIPGAEAGDRLCYKLRCPRVPAKSLDIIDGFGSRRISVTGKPAYLCTSVSRAAAPGSPCGLGGAGLCGGVCQNPGDRCLAVSTQDCGCVPATEACDQSTVCSAGFCTGVWETCATQVTGVCGCVHPPS